jgi:hypothetical protein
MNDYQMLHLANASMLERRAEAERSRIAAAARTAPQVARSRMHKLGPVPSLRLRSLFGRA